jgi:tetratricopeptide (TPR) repeat protein
MTRKKIIMTTLVAFLLSGFFLNGCAMFTFKAQPNPKLAARYVKQGRALEQDGALIKAHEQYKLAATVDPGNIEARQRSNLLALKLSKLADGRYKLGMKYHRQGKYGLARKEFLTALKYQPDHPKASKMLVSRQPKKPPEYWMHTIQKGESLSIIAKRFYGNHQKTDIIKRFNNMGAATRLRPGQIIIIPNILGTKAPAVPYAANRKNTGFVWHTIAPGQSISELAYLYYGDYKQFHVIARYNDMEDATRIKVGDRVKVPKVAGLPFNDPVKRAPKAPAQPSQPEISPAPVTVTLPAPGPHMDEIPPPESNGKGQAVAYRDTGIEFYNQGKYQDAIFELNKAVEAAPADELTRTYLAKAYFESGKELFDQDDFNAAREAFESSRQYNPLCEACGEYIEKAKARPALVYRANGIDYLNKHDFSGAIAEFDKYLEEKPDDAEGRSLLSKAYFQKALIDYNKGDFMSAKKGFEAALEYDSQCEKCTDYVRQSLNSYKDAHYNKGVAFYGQQQLAEAVDEWERVYALDPGYKNVEQNLKKALDLLEKLDRIKKSRQP